MSVVRIGSAEAAAQMVAHVRLPALADAIRAEHAACERDARSAVEHAIRAGELLTEAKAAVQHGAWLPWLTENFPATRSTAAGYMRMAANVQRVAHFDSVREALRELADPRESDDNLPDEIGPSSVEPPEQGGPAEESGPSADVGSPEGEVLDGEPVPDEQEQDMAPASRAQAVDLAERGMSYRQIGQELGVDESRLRRDPVVREARLKGDPDAHSTVNGSSVACRVESPSELITRIRQDHERILSRTYTLGSADQKVLHKTLVKTTRRLEEMMQDA